MKHYMPLILLAIVFFFVWKYIKNKPLTRVDIIDFLNNNLGANPAWVKMDDQELRDIYALVKLKDNGVNPSPLLKQKVGDISMKYTTKQQKINGN